MTAREGERERVKLSFSQQVRFFKDLKAHLKTKSREKPKQWSRLLKVHLHEIKRIMESGKRAPVNAFIVFSFIIIFREINHIEMLFNLMCGALWKRLQLPLFNLFAIFTERRSYQFILPCLCSVNSIHKSQVSHYSVPLTFKTLTFK